MHKFHKAVPIEDGTSPRRACALRRVIVQTGESAWHSPSQLKNEFPRANSRAFVNYINFPVGTDEILRQWFESFGSKLLFSQPTHASDIT